MSTNLQAQDFIVQARHSPDLTEFELLPLVAYQPINNIDVNEQFRTSVCQQLNRTMGNADRLLIVYLLQQEVLILQRASMSDTLLLCAFMVFKLGYLDDVKEVWEAKMTNFDTFCAVDSRFLLGAGVDKTIDYLLNQNDTRSMDILTWIEDFDPESFDVDTFRERWELYFKTKLAGSK